jgi:hypothetical protein
MCPSPAGFQGSYQLFTGAERARVAWDPSAWRAPGRMPSFFFCAPVVRDPAHRDVLLARASPRSRLLMSRS